MLSVHDELWQVPREPEVIVARVDVVEEAELGEHPVVQHVKHLQGVDHLCWDGFMTVEDEERRSCIVSCTPSTSVSVASSHTANPCPCMGSCHGLLIALRRCHADDCCIHIYTFSFLIYS